jgi:MFS family permease
MRYRLNYRQKLSGALGFILLITVFYAAGRGSIISFFADFAFEQGLSRLSLFFVSFAIAVIIMRPFTGRLTDRIGRLRMLVPSIIIFAGSLFYIPFIDSTVELIVGGAFCGVGQAFIYPVLMSLALGHTNQCDIGLTIGIFTAVFDAGIGGGAFVWGAVANALNYHAMYLIAAAGVLWTVTLKKKIAAGTPSR